MKTPVNKKTLKQHFAYSWWKYLLLIVLGVGAICLIYDTTQYRTPPEKKVDLYIYGAADEENLNAWLESVRRSEMPDMEQLSCVMMLDDSQYGPIQLMTYIAAGEGNIYFLPREQFLSMTKDGSCIALEEDEELMAVFDKAGTSLQSGWRKNSETGETHLYGIPLSKLPGLDQYCSVRNGYACIPVTALNAENTKLLFRILCRDFIKPAPEKTHAEDGEAAPAP